MRTKLIAVAALFGAIGVAVIVAVAIMASGDGGGGQTAIRTQKGLGLASAVPSGGGGTLITEGQAAGTRQSLPATGVSGDVIGRTAYPGPAAPGGLGAPQLTPAGGITVQGYGSASAPADSAVVEFSFTRPPGYYGEPKPVPPMEPVPGGEPGIESPVATPSPVQPITEETLKPVIDALVAAGVARGDIEVVGQYQYYGEPGYASATLRAKVSDVASLDNVVEAVRQAAAGLGNGIVLNGTSVSYTVDDCLALEKEAMKAAAADAGERAAAFAEALGVGLGDLVAASHWSWAPYGAACGQQYFGVPYPLGGMAYAGGQPQEVQVMANISATYAIR